MKFLLINPIVRISFPPSYFPLGIAYIASSLIKEGHHVEILDINAYRWLPWEVERIIEGDESDIYGLTGLITEYKQIKWLTKVIKKYHPTKKIILGGGLASTCTEIVLKRTEVDIAVIGEGELTMKKLTETLENDGDLQNVAGIAYKDNMKIYQTSPRSPIECLDSTPFPEWELFPIMVYMQSVKLGFDYPYRTMNIISSRGCPYKCVYCDHSVFGHKFRKRSVQNVIEEIKILKDKFGIEGVVFSDDLFIANRKWVKEFCEEVMSQDVKIRWVCNGRVNLVDPDLLNMMKLAGCQGVFFGIESGSQKILDVMQKKIYIEKAKEAIRITRDAGLMAGTYFMIGMMGETEETVKETIDFCKEMQLNAQFSFTTPIPGTLLFQKALELGKITDLGSLLERWDKWNDNLVLNLTEIPDKELIHLKMIAEEQIRFALFRNVSPVRKITENLIRLYNGYGLSFIIRKSLLKISRMAKFGIDPYLHEIKKVEASSKYWSEVLK